MFDLRGKKEKSHVPAAGLMRLGLAYDFNSSKTTSHSSVCVLALLLYMFGLLGHGNFNKSKHVVTLVKFKQILTGKKVHCLLSIV